MTGSSRIDVIDMLESLSVHRFLSMLDEARVELAELKGCVKKKVDKGLLKCIEIDLEIRHRLDQVTINSEQMRVKFQKIYNTLSDPQTSGTRGTGVFPPWAFRRELIRCDYWTTLLANAFSDPNRGNLYRHIESARKLFEESKRCDHDTNRHYILMLLNMNEFAHARQALSEAIVLNRSYSPYFLLLAELAVREMRFEDALRHLQEAKRIMGGKPVLGIDFPISYCHYFLGNYDEAARLMKQGKKTWPESNIFDNNLAFLEVREARRVLGTDIWKKNPKLAVSLLERFLNSIARIGTHDTAHFNYALLVYWSALAGKLDLARQVLNDNRRQNVQQIDSVVSYLFRKARGDFIENRDYVHAFVSSYFAERAEAEGKVSIRDRLLDELAWDTDNFYTFRYHFNNRKRSLLTKDRRIKDIYGFGHIATLRRWRRASHPFTNMGVQVGGGYFVKWRRKGLVINPGVGFAENFQRRGYSVNEIDAVVVTSSHYSAYEEFTGLLELVKRAYASGQKKERVAVYLEGSVLQRFPDLAIRKLPCLQNPQVLPDRETFFCDDFMSVEATSPCDECGHREGNGLGDAPYNPPVMTVLKLHAQEECKRTLGIITGFCPSRKATSFLKGCDYLLLNLGAICPYDLFRDSINEALRADLMQLFQDDSLYMESFGIQSIEELNENHKSDNDVHYCRRGEKHNLSLEQLLCIASHLRRMKGKVAVIGNLPAELGDKRHKIASVLNACYPDGALYLTEDLGLMIGLEKNEVLCEYEHKLVPVSGIDEECIEGRLTGPVRHFCANHRSADDFAEFLRLDI